MHLIAILRVLIQQKHQMLIIPMELQRHITEMGTHSIIRLKVRPKIHKRATGFLNDTLQIVIGGM